VSEPTVPVQYDCRYCNTEGAVVEVPERYPEEHICDWVNLVSAMVGRHHRHHRHHCVSATVDLKIPLPPDHQYLGKARHQ